MHVFSLHAFIHSYITLSVIPTMYRLQPIMLEDLPNIHNDDI